jgi:hypothetical protein
MEYIHSTYNTFDTAIEHNGNLVFDDIDKSELFNKFFCEQSKLDDSDHTPPDLTELQTDGLRQIIITETDVEDILKIYFLKENCRCACRYSVP